MDKYIEQQLKSCRVAKISEPDENGTIYISKYQEPKYELHKCYLVKLPQDIVNNPHSNLAINWNKSTAPTNNCLKIFVSTILGTMIYVDSLAYDYENQRDLTEQWSGWIDTKYIAQIKCL